MREIGSKQDYIERQEYLEALDRGYQMQFRPTGRGHSRWVINAIQNALAVRRANRAFDKEFEKLLKKNTGSSNK